MFIRSDKFLEIYFISVIIYLFLSCLLFDPFNIIGYILVSLSVISVFLIHTRNRIGKYLCSVTCIFIIIIFSLAASFSIQFTRNYFGLLFDISLIIFSAFSFLALIILLSSRRPFQS